MEGKSVMWFHFLLVVFILDAVCATCPTAEHMQPCQCRHLDTYSEGNPIKVLVVSCENAQVGRVQKALEHVAQSNIPVKLWLESIELGHLPQQFLSGLNLERFTAEHCNLSAVDEDAFSDSIHILKWIDLSHNDLERVPTGSLNKLRSLSYLYLNFNRLEVLHANSFKGIHSLEVLSLRGNRLKFIDESAFELGSKFAYIYLGENELTAFPSQGLSRPGVIEQLNMEDNKISSLHPEDFSGMRAAGSVDSLRLYNNRIRHIPPRTFSSLNRLKDLELDGNEIEFLDPLAFEGIGDTLEFLSVADNLFQKLPAESLRDMRVLEYLYLEGNRISTIRENDFVPYGSRIKYLYLGNNLLTFLHPMSLVPLHSLDILDLMNNQLDTVPYETYAPVLDTLTSFDLQGNPLHCDCKIAWLKDVDISVFASYLAICASPEEYANTTLYGIPKDLLICVNPM